MSSPISPKFNLRHIKDGRWLKDVCADGSEVKSREQSEALAFSQAGAEYILGNLNHLQGIRYEIVPA